MTRTTRAGQRSREGDLSQGREPRGRQSEEHRICSSLANSQFRPPSFFHCPASTEKRNSLATCSGDNKQVLLIP